MINVSWEDTRAYAVWLRETTGKPYRLPSEAEWEYACRAGTTTRYWWCNEIYGISPEHANWGGTVVGRTAEVGRYPANLWGLYDVVGNVWEWVEDCWHRGYRGAPTDGSAWQGEENPLRVIRVGSWDGAGRDLRSASRIQDMADGRHNNVGFRVARALTA